MGLVFTASTPRIALHEPLASQLTDSLREQYGDAVVLDSDVQRNSEEIGWSGWGSLQERAESACGADMVPHLLSVDLPLGFYLPVQTDVGKFEVPDEYPSFNFGSLVKLIAELELIGNALELPTDDSRLTLLFDKYFDDDDLIDEDMDIQTYCLLLPFARFALDQRLLLWVVVH